ncbi:MAG: hypothetical protein B6I20_06785 [Bacteroidetes bacterium 4572_117]|nr:MAG: hypothetical protein B6I20_06785 [Bacteroidetes bacterium 4572_117]
MLNPILKNSATILIYSFIWLVLLCGQWFLLLYFYEIPGLVALYDSLVFNSMFAVLGIGVWYVVKFNEIENSSIIKVVIVHFISSLIIATIWLTVTYYFAVGLYEDTGYVYFFEQSLTWRFVTGIFYYLVLTLIYYLILYNQNLKQKIKDEANLKALIWQAEVEALKNQINPHFLFNSLNSISSLTVTSPEKARDMIVKLSDLMRYSLKANPNYKTSIEAELQNIERYLSIEKVRFGNKLQYRAEIETECKNKLLPVMILQPLIENAIKHGVYESTGKININLKCDYLNNNLIVKIVNNYDNELVVKDGAGIGLTNIRQRLHLLYRRNDLLETTIEDSLFKVKLVIPQ